MIRRFTIAVLLLTSIGLAAQDSRSASVTLKAAIAAEQIERDLPKAIGLYERAVKEAVSDRTLAPQILLRLALAQLKAGREQDAHATFQRILRDYSDSGEPAAVAKARLATPPAGGFRQVAVDLNVKSDAPVAYSDDGRAIAYLTNAASQLWVRDVDSGRDRSLLNLKGRHIGNLRWSPDGRFLALTSRDPSDPATRNIPKVSGSHDVRIVTVASGQSRTLATSESGDARYDRVEWSPDGRWVVLSFGITMNGGVGDIRLVDVTTGQSRTLVTPAVPTWFVWSADSRDVAFVAPGTPRGRGSLLRTFSIASAATAQVRPVNFSLDTADGDVWPETGATSQMTTDGRVLLRHQGRGGYSLYLVAAADGATELMCRTLPPVRCSGQMTADGRFKLGRDDSTQRLLVFDRSKGGAPSRLTNGFADEDKPYLSPDGRVVLFASNPDGDWALYALPLDRAPLARPLRVMSLGTTNMAVEAWSSDGRVLLNVQGDDSQVFRINVDRGGHPIGPAGRLTRDGRVSANPAISPDSKVVAYYSNNGTRIATVNADGTREQSIGQPEIGPLRHLEWLSNGRLIFQTPRSIAAFDVNTGGIQPLGAVFSGSEFEKSFQRTDKWQYVDKRREVFYTSNAMGGFDLHATAVDTGVDRLVSTIRYPINAGITFRVSPDATQIAYGRFSGIEESAHAELHVMNIDGTGDRTVATAMNAWIDRAKSKPMGSPYDWSPDGRLLLYDEYPGRLMVVNVQTGESWPIAEATNSDRVRWSGAQWSPDGSFIVLQRNEIKQEFLKLEGLTYENIVKLMDAKK
jgi:Tol biopolymer transport system component